METSLFLAQIIGPSLVLVSLAWFWRPQSVSDMIVFIDANRAWIFFMGIIATVLGLAMVLVHNIWDGSWRTIITLFGWGILLKGIVRLFAPDWALVAAKALVSNKLWTKILLAFLFIMGLYLSYRGFL